MLRKLPAWWTGALSCRSRPERRLLRAPLRLEELESRAVPALFGPAQDFGSGANPGTVAVGDFNGDGALDMAVVNQGDGTVSVLKNSGAGAFTPFGPNIAVGGSPEDVVVGDFFSGLNDHNLDLLVSNDGGYVSLLRGHGDGTFDAPVNIQVPGGIISYVAVGDFNGDGALDFAAADFANNDVLVYQGDGKGGFAAPVTLGAGLMFHPEQIVVADLDGDGKPDLAVANQGGLVGITVFRNTSAAGGAVSFAAGQDFAQGIDIGDANPTDYGCTGLVAGDYDGDGRLDLATTDFGSNHFAGGTGPAGDAVSVFQNGSTPGHIVFGISSALNFTVGQNPVGITQGDFNGDGKLDLAVTSNGNGGQVSVLLNARAQPDVEIDFAAPQNFPVGGAPLGPVGMAVNYFRGDGSLDPTGGRAPDLNGDGAPDLVTAVPNNGADVAVLFSQPPVVTEIPGAGVWRFEDATGWQQLTPADASQVGVDSRGDVVAEIPGAGVWRFEDATGWQQLTPTDAPLIRIADGDVAAEIPVALERLARFLEDFIGLAASRFSRRRRPAGRGRPGRSGRGLAGRGGVALPGLRRLATTDRRRRLPGEHRRRRRRGRRNPRRGRLALRGRRRLAATDRR